MANEIIDKVYFAIVDKNLIFPFGELIFKLLCNYNFLYRNGQNPLRNYLHRFFIGLVW